MCHICGGNHSVMLVMIFIHSLRAARQFPQTAHATGRRALYSVRRWAVPSTQEAQTQQQRSQPQTRGPASRQRRTAARRTRQVNESGHVDSPVATWTSQWRWSWLRIETPHWLPVVSSPPSKSTPTCRRARAGGAQAVRKRCASGVQAVRKRCASGVQAVCKRCASGAEVSF